MPAASADSAAIAAIAGNPDTPTMANTIIALELADRPDPVAGPGECLIRVAASGINRPDVLQRKGAYAPPPGASDLPGLEIAPDSGDAHRRRCLEALALWR